MAFPGKAAGFSCVRSRNPPFIPVASEMLDSPNLSLTRSTAESACFHLSSAWPPAIALLGLLKRRRLHRAAVIGILAPVGMKEAANLLEDCRRAGGDLYRGRGL